MKDLKNILEGILDPSNKGNVGANLKDLYPTPTIKDFKKGYWGGVYVEWECEDLIKQYLTHLDLPSFNYISKDEVCGIRLDIDSDKIVTTSLITKVHSSIDLRGVGDYVGNLAVAKKSVIKSLNMLKEQPNLFIKLFKFAEKCEEQINKTGVGNCKPIEDILNS